MLLEKGKIDFFKITNDLQNQNYPSENDNSLSFFQNLKHLSHKSYFIMHVLPPDLNKDKYWYGGETGTLSEAFHLCLERPPDC
jgi:hypothetical protein